MCYANTKFMEQDVFNVSSPLAIYLQNMSFVCVWCDREGVLVVAISMVVFGGSLREGVRFHLSRTET